VASRACCAALAAPERAGFEIEFVVVETVADRRLDISIESMGGKGVFVKEVQEAVLDGRADIAVHSAKDLPASTVDGLVLASITERADPRDVLVGARYDALPFGAHCRDRARNGAGRSWLFIDLIFASVSCAAILRRVWARRLPTMRSSWPKRRSIDSNPSFARTARCPRSSTPSIPR
jgi:hypothetical protein